MDILRFITAGNVDDGKSTLIGRLLYDTHNVKNDVLDSVSSANDVTPNLAHITDGLRSEREQGITIDVAYKYFTTKNRKYIVSDAPGHFQYTKNLVTGASGVDVMIILIDAQNGITEQTKRHTLAASFLKIKLVVVAINKMDLVGYDPQIFDLIKTEFSKIADMLELSNVTYIPISAFNGDNVSFHSEKMGWYNGNTLEQYLESCEPAKQNDTITRFTVQHVVADGRDELVYGNLISGKLSQSHVIAILPQKSMGIIKKISEGFDEVNEAVAGQNLCLTLVNYSKTFRGNVISFFNQKAEVGNDFEATLCWLDTEKSLQIGTDYFLRIGSQETKANITDVEYKIDVNSFEKINYTCRLKVNEFAKVKITTKDPIVYDKYAVLPETGRGILIDTVTNYTSGAFIIE